MKADPSIHPDFLAIANNSHLCGFAVMSPDFLISFLLNYNNG